jgi:hypothetical protein
MEKYNLNEGNESLKRVLLMMGYDSKKTLEENTKIIFEQEEAGDLINKYGKKMGVTLPSDLATPATGAPATGVPATGAPATGAPATAAPATPEVSLSYEDTVKKLQNLLITKYQAKLGESGPNKNGVRGARQRVIFQLLIKGLKSSILGLFFAILGIFYPKTHQNTWLLGFLPTLVPASKTTVQINLKSEKHGL